METRTTTTCYLKKPCNTFGKTLGGGGTPLFDVDGYVLLNLVRF